MAILGATGHIGKGLVRELAGNTDYHLGLFVRDHAAMASHMEIVGAGAQNYDILELSDFGNSSNDIVINAIGAGDPARLAALGHGIFRLTEDFDNLILEHLERYPDVLYLNFSSGAVYGAGFSSPPTAETRFNVAVNDLPTSQHYGLAKLYAEAKHRAHGDLNIVDLRVFSYFSQFIDLSGRFFMADLVRCLIAEKVFVTNDLDFVRDFIVPADLALMIDCCVAAWKKSSGVPVNCGLDFYSKKPAGKFELIDQIRDIFPFEYQIEKTADTLTATGAKSHYASEFKKAGAWGYAPCFTTTEGVISEARRLLEKSSRGA